MRFSKDVKVINHTGLRDAVLTWYTPSSSGQICLYGLKHCLRFRNFSPISPNRIVEVLASREKFLEASGYRTVINGAFPFHTTNSFGYFRGIMTQIELVRH